MIKTEIECELQNVCHITKLKNKPTVQALVVLLKI